MIHLLYSLFSFVFKIHIYNTGKLYDMMSQSFPPKALIYSTRHIKACFFSIVFICILIYSPPVWNGVCGTGLTSHMTPCGTLSRRSMPRVSIRLL